MFNYLQHVQVLLSDKSMEGCERSHCWARLSIVSDLAKMKLHSKNKSQKSEVPEQFMVSLEPRKLNRLLMDYIFDPAIKHAMPIPK